MAQQLITEERLKELFDYNPETGDLIRKVTWRTAKAGDVAGREQNGNTYIDVSGKAYPAKNLVWLFHYGKMPDSFVRHINGIKTDNRIENLAESAPPCKARKRSPLPLASLAHSLEFLNQALIQSHLDTNTRVRVMRDFAALHHVPSESEQ